MASKFSLSANIETGELGSEQYIVTPNVQKVTHEIVSQYHSGIHTFTLIGTYGTGKSSFLVTLENDLRGKGPASLIKDTKVLTSTIGFDFVNIVGEYQSLEILLYNKIASKASGSTALEKLQNYYNRLKKQNRMLVIVIDEFGKILEHAAKNEVEKELYFMQQLAEFANVTSRNILFLTTLHQNFGAYASKLTTAQKNEWTKVKGRFQEVVFTEPVEQQLYMAAQSLDHKTVWSAQIQELYDIAKATKIASATFQGSTVARLYPLDPFSAIVLTRAIQKYGQNERSLFSFINYNGEKSIGRFVPSNTLTYNLSEVYDYVIANFHSYLSEPNSDTMGWSAISVAIDRVESLEWDSEEAMTAALKTVKSIGLLNIFGNAGFTMSETFLCRYMSIALDIKKPDDILIMLNKFSIIRYAVYKQRYILFEGTDVDIEHEIIKASSSVAYPNSPANDLRVYFKEAFAQARSHYYKTGTPRFFEYTVFEEPTELEASGEIDGYVEIVLSTDADIVEKVRQFSENIRKPILYAVFKHLDKLTDHLHKIKVYQYIINVVLVDKQFDKIALSEINRLIDYEQSLLTKLLKESLFSFNGEVVWYYEGKQVSICSQKDFNTVLSKVCDDIYSSTPIIHNELINKSKLSSNISAARIKYLQALVDGCGEIDLGFEQDKFPPEKAIFYTLLKNTGLYDGQGFNNCPSNDEIMPLWEASEAFLHSTQDKPRKVSELISILSEKPYKVKLGVLDFWIPTYLYIKRLDYSLFGKSGSYVPDVNMEFFELLKKHPSEFSVKAYAEDGVKMEFYNQYRKFINVEEAGTIKGDKFIETVKPFFFFYSHLNDYAKHTQKFNHITTLRFRDVLSNAKDPEKTFFEDLPEALGYDKSSANSEQFVANYCAIIQLAVRELRSCYNSLIDRIEEQLIGRLELQSYEYSDYVKEIRQRLSRIKVHLLSDKQRDFYNHALAEFDSRKEWYQSICYSALDQPLERLRDEQEEQLIDNLIYLFRECEKHSVISEAMDFQIGEAEKQRSLNIEAQIERLLSENDNNLNIYALMNVLKRKMQ